MNKFVPIQNWVWGTLEKDPLFQQPVTSFTLAQNREITFRRLKRLFEYDFVTMDEAFQVNVAMEAKILNNLN